ncbi:ribosomal protein L7/L12, partial [Bacillus sp. Xin]
QIGIPEHEVNEELRQLVRDGEKIEAIKKAREVLGLSLLEAKNYIDSL